MQTHCSCFLIVLGNSKKEKKKKLCYVFKINRILTLVFFCFGSTDVFVAKNATVAELKQAIEEVFVSSVDEISW